MLLLVAFTLFRPGFWLDRVDPPFDDIHPSKVYEVVDNATPDGVLTMIVTGPDFDTGEITSTTILVPMGDQAAAIARLEKAGLTVTVEDGRAIIEEPFPGSPFFETIGKTFDYYTDNPVELSSVRTKKDRVPKEVFYLPAVLLLGLVYWAQRRRSMKKIE